MKKFAVSSYTKDTHVKKKAKAKILFIMCYYILLGALVLTLFTYLEAVGGTVYEAIEQHFTCQSAGLETGRDCGKTLQEQLSPFKALSTLSTIVSGLLPSVILAFTVKCECKKRTNIK